MKDFWDFVGPLVADRKASGIVGTFRANNWKDLEFFYAQPLFQARIEDGSAQKWSDKCKGNFHRTTGHNVQEGE